MPLRGGGVHTIAFGKSGHSVGGEGAKLTGLRYRRRMRVGSVGTVQIMPPLPVPKKPRFDEAFCIFGECAKQCYLLRDAQHAMIR